VILLLSPRGARSLSADPSISCHPCRSTRSGGTWITPDRSKQVSVQPQTRLEQRAFVRFLVTQSRSIKLGNAIFVDGLRELREPVYSWART